MRKLNQKSSGTDSFKYSMLISLHYYDISFHRERISKLKPFETKHNFIHLTPDEFEINNSSTSLKYLMKTIKKYIHQKIIVLIKHK